MGAYSELDITLRNGDAPFEDADGSPAFVDDGAFAEDDAPCAPSPAGTDDMPRAESDTVSPAQSAEPQAATPAQPTDVKADNDVQKQADEDAKRKAHEEAEAKRKAEFDAKQAAKKAAEQEQLAKLEAMSPEELLSASMQRVSADTEKLTRRNMKECVAEHIQTLCLSDPAFARKVMHPRKSMIRCFQYISRKAWDYVQDEMKANGIQPGPGRQGYGSDVPDDLCYQWAEDYFNDPDAKEDHEDEEKFVPKPYYGGTSKSKNAKKEKKDKKDAKPKPQKETAKTPEPKSAESSGQISLGDFLMPEEKAG